MPLVLSVGFVAVGEELDVRGDRLQIFGAENVLVALHRGSGASFPDHLHPAWRLALCVRARSAEVSRLRRQAGRSQSISCALGAVAGRTVLRKDRRATIGL